MKKTCLWCCLYLALISISSTTTTTKKNEYALLKEMLLNAIISGNLKETMKVIEKNPTLVNIHLKKGYAALHWAICAKHEHIVDYLLSISWIKPNVRAAYRLSTPLHLAAMSGQMMLVKKLCTHPAIKLNALDVQQQTPLHFASSRGDVEIINYLCSLSGVKVNLFAGTATPLLNTINSGSLAAVVALCSCSRVDLFLTDNDGLHPIHTAAGNNLPNIIEFLLLRGVPVNIKNIYGHSPIHTAAYFGNRESIAVLIKYGAEINAPTQKIRTKKIQTPLKIAITMGHYAAAAFMTSLGAQITPALWRSIGRKKDFSTLVDALLIDQFVKTSELNAEEQREICKSMRAAIKDKQDKRPLTRICRAYVQLITTIHEPPIAFSQKEVLLGKKYFKFPPYR